MKPEKTIAQHMVDVLNENDVYGVMYGDVHFLDQCAERCTHADLMELLPTRRQSRIYRALGKSDLFETVFIRMPGERGHANVRAFQLRGKPEFIHLTDE